MRLKCNDGIVREFDVPKYVWKYDMPTIPLCLECGEEFPNLLLFELKPLFRQHICNKEKRDWYTKFIKREKKVKESE